MRANTCSPDVGSTQQEVAPLDVVPCEPVGPLASRQLAPPSDAPPSFHHVRPLERSLLQNLLHERHCHNNRCPTHMKLEHNAMPPSGKNVHSHVKPVGMHSPDQNGPMSVTRYGGVTANVPHVLCCSYVGRGAQDERRESEQGGRKVPNLPPAALAAHIVMELTSLLQTWESSWVT